MSVRVVQLGSPRLEAEGLRIGTVRRPPRGVPKAEYASRDLYDLWLPELAPSEALLKAGRLIDTSSERRRTGRKCLLAPCSAGVSGGSGGDVRVAIPRNSDRRWRQFVRRYRMEMSRPEARHLLDLLAALSRRTNFSVGCYCANETRCHRSILRQLLAEHGAVFE